MSQLSREQVDIVMGFRTKPLDAGAISFTALIESRLCCIVRKDSPLAGLESLGPEDVAGLPQVVCLPPGLRRHGSAAQSEIPDAGNGLTTHCATSSEAYALVDAGFGYAIVPSLYTMPDPFHQVIAWRGRARSAYGVYHRRDERTGVVAEFVRIAREVFGSPGYERPLHEGWDNTA